MKSSVLYAAVLFLCIGAVGAQDTQKFSLGKPSGSRFTIPDITWPAAHGDADVCMWDDDKLAATCITIDDNCSSQHDWWLAKGDSLGFKFTWFVITGWVRGDERQIGGSWRQFRKLYDRGHAVQSHSVAHGSNDVFQEVYGTGALYTEHWDWYYGGARDIIEDSIPGDRCYTMAAPGSGSNNLDTAMQYHIANRGVTAWPNYGNAIDFTGVRATSAFGESFVLTTVTKTATVWGKNFRRGLSVFLYHSINTATVAPQLDFIKQHHDSLWVGTFPDVMRYNMEYATHTLTQTGLSDTTVSFTVADSMADSIYTYPLTVKVRLNNDWDTCIATQDGEAVDVSVIEHEGDKYALVKAVPDAGEVTLRNVAAPVSEVRNMPVDGSALAGSRNIRVFRMDGQEISSGQIQRAGVYMTFDGKAFAKVIVMP